MTSRKIVLPRRKVSGLGIDISVLGFGGFHQVEILQETVSTLLDTYLTAGGNYIETARGYGNGASEKKIATALRGVDRNSYLLASKSAERTYEGAWRQINESLECLGTDYLNFYFFHNLATPGDLSMTLSDSGALKAFERAKSEGLIKNFAMSSHWPLFYLEASKHIDIDAVLIWGNYLDFCNFPEIPNKIIPELRESGTGIFLMKPVGDGFLHRSPENAFQYALAQDCDCVVSGFNSMEMLTTDLDICSREPASDENVKTILRDARELNDYVCRQCQTCGVLNGKEGEALKAVFEIEGKIDRQMDDRRPVPVHDYALRERLKSWFKTDEYARAMYQELGCTIDDLLNLTKSACSYGLDVDRKLIITQAKIDGEDSVNLL